MNRTQPFSAVISEILGDPDVKAEVRNSFQGLFYRNRRLVGTETPEQLGLVDGEVLFTYVFPAAADEEWLVQERHDTAMETEADHPQVVDPPLAVQPKHQRVEVAIPAEADLLARDLPADLCQVWVEMAHGQSVLYTLERFTPLASIMDELHEELGTGFEGLFFKDAALDGSETPAEVGLATGDVLTTYQAAPISAMARLARDKIEASHLLFVWATAPPEACVNLKAIRNEIGQRLTARPISFQQTGAERSWDVQWRRFAPGIDGMYHTDTMVSYPMAEVLTGGALQAYEVEFNNLRDHDYRIKVHFYVVAVKKEGV